MYPVKAPGHGLSGLAPAPCVSRRNSGAWDIKSRAGTNALRRSTVYILSPVGGKSSPNHCGPLSFVRTKHAIPKNKPLA